MLKYKVETLEGIDEAAQALYKEQDGGGYVLQVEGVVPQDRYNELNQKAVDNATEAQRRRKTVERVLERLGLESAEGLDEAIDALKSAKGRSSEQNDQIVAQIKADAEAKIKDAEARYTGVLMQGAVSETKAALQEAGFPVKVAEMLAKTSTDRLKVDGTGKVRIMADNGNPLAGSGGDGYATYGDLAKELAAAMPDLLVNKGMGGGGKPPASKGGDTSKTVTRTDFDAMSHVERATFVKSGGKVTDG